MQLAMAERKGVLQTPNVMPDVMLTEVSIGLFFPEPVTPNLFRHHRSLPSFVMLTEVSIGLSLPEPVMPNLFRHHHSLPEPLSISMFASRGISHANKIISFHCLLSKTPSLRKETREWLRKGNVYRGNVSKHVLRKPCDNLSLRLSRIAGLVLNCRKMF